MLRVGEYYSGTDKGLQRRANEDSLLARAPLFVVADGMGGAQAGEVASRIAVETFRGGLMQSASPEQALAERAQAANAEIHELSQRDAAHAGMGTTLTAAYVGEHEVAIAHVGDSRAYRLRDGELLRLTDDHSLVDELIRQGRLTPEEAEDHPQRSIITRALGPEASVEVDTSSQSARASDVYLLCSDGLTSMVPEASLAELLRANPLLRNAGEALIAAANRAGGRDNITVVLFRLEEADGPDERSHAQDRTATGLPVLQAGMDADHAQQLTAEHEVPAALGLAVRRPRPPERPLPATQPPAPPTGRRARRASVAVVVVVVVALLFTGAYLASQSVYFIGTNGRGLVTLFRGVPYELPAGIKLYTVDFVSGVGASTLSPERRRTLLDHSLRSQADASGLIRELELGRLSAG